MLGALTLFMGTAVLASRLVSPLAVLLGWPMRRMGGARRAASPTENARRDPGRTAATAAALMIGVSLVTFISIFAAAIKPPRSDEIDRQVQRSSSSRRAAGLGASTPRRRRARHGRAGRGQRLARSRDEISLVDGNRHVAHGVTRRRSAAPDDFDWARDDALARDSSAQGRT